MEHLSSSMITAQIVDLKNKFKFNCLSFHAKPCEMIFGQFKRKNNYLNKVLFIRCTI